MRKGGIGVKHEKDKRAIAKQHGKEDNIQDEERSGGISELERIREALRTNNKKALERITTGRIREMTRMAEKGLMRSMGIDTVMPETKTKKRDMMEQLLGIDIIKP